MQVGGECMALGGLVQSCFSLGQQWSTFLVGKAREGFLQAGEAVLDDETFETLPGENRLAVELGAGRLGLTIAELRSRLRLALEEQIGIPPTEESLEISEDEESGGNRLP